MPIELASRPHVVATVTRPGDLGHLENVAKPEADLLEFRMDDLLPERERAADAMERTEVPVLLTVRRPDEGGAGSLADETRVEIYREMAARAAVVDTEIASLRSPAFDGFRGAIAHSDALLVGSFHDFHGFPGVEFLREQAEAARELGCDIVKFAVSVDRMDQLFDLAKLVEEIRSSGRLVSAMGMGSLGRLSRLVLARAGSCLNYGYLRTANAPGQWSAAELRRLIAEI